MLISGFGKLPLHNDMFYIIYEDGHVYNFDFEEFRWKDVSAYTEYDSSFYMYKTTQEFDNEMVDYYDAMSRYHILSELKYGEKHSDFTLGEKYTYYKKGKDVLAVDENKVEYNCLKCGKEVREDKVFDSSWKRISRLDVIYAVGGFSYIIDLHKDELYKDKNGDVHIFCSNNKEYRLSLATKELSIVHDGKQKPEDYEKVTFDYIKDKEDELQTFICQEEVSYLNELDDYIEESRKLLKEKYNITLGNDIYYYNNGWKNIYAIDNFGNEYHLLSTGLVNIEKGSVDKENWDRCENLCVMRYVNFYSERQSRRENEGENFEISLLDLKLFQNKFEEIYGIEEDGTYYYEYEDGALIQLTDDEVEELNKESHEIKPGKEFIDVIIKHAINRGISLTDAYIGMVMDGVKEAYGFELGHQIEFFVTPKGSEHPLLCLKDNNGNDFVCNTQHLQYMGKDFITPDFEKISFYALKWYLITTNTQYCDTDEECEEIMNNSREGEITITRKKKPF